MLSELTAEDGLEERKSSFRGKMEEIEENGPLLDCSLRGDV